MKKLIASIVLAFALITPVQAQEEDFVILTPPQICSEFVEIAFVLAANYLVHGADKEAQLEHLRTNVFPQVPYLALFEPGVIKALDALMHGREYLDSVPEEEYRDTAVKFATSTGAACMADEAVGWVVGLEKMDTTPDNEPKADLIRS